MNELITILGPTASGKTTLAVALAHKLNTEIISADSRQVYRGMNIGTGKDLCEYTIDEKQIPYHLIDICEAGEKYNVYEYQHDFHRVFTEIRNKGKLPILCGGTGMYIEAVLKGFRLLTVPENPGLRKSLEKKSLTELEKVLESYGSLHNTSDFDSSKRAIRAIEIAAYTKTQNAEYTEFKTINSLIVGIDVDRETRRNRISKRLKERLNEGMIEEVKLLIDKGITSEDLIYYGLEYKFVTQYLIGELSYKEMFSQLEIAIHQFAKRQMTWFRGMERRGFAIEWIDSDLSMNEKINRINELLIE